MDDPRPDYEPRYLAGIICFNNQDYFEAHEVWESLWLDYSGPERTFFQGLIQAAVALYHFGNGNFGGARKLFHSSKKYMEGYGPKHLGLDVPTFWNDMDRCFATLLSQSDPDRGLRPDPELLPAIKLDPAPATWPNVEDFLEEED